jgi:hypothetical protein
MVSLREWTCAACSRPVTQETKHRLESAPTKAPDGYAWVLLVGDSDDCEDDEIHGWVQGLYSDRAQIGRSLVRNLDMGADGVRDVLRRTHWYQGVFNEMVIEGWEEEADRRGVMNAYYLTIERIN